MVFGTRNSDLLKSDISVMAIIKVCVRDPVTSGSQWSARRGEDSQTSSPQKKFEPRGNLSCLKLKEFQLLQEG